MCVWFLNFKRERNSVRTRPELSLSLCVPVADRKSSKKSLIKQLHSQKSVNSGPAFKFTSDFGSPGAQRSR